MIELEENKNKFFNSLLIDNLESKVEKINQIEDKIIHNKKKVTVQVTFFIYIKFENYRIISINSSNK